MLLLLGGLMALALGTAPAHSRRLTSDALLTTGDATTAQTQTQTQTASARDPQCRDAHALVVAALHDKHGALHALLHNCTRMLLYTGYKWVDADQAKAYCKSDACRQFVAKLDDAFPTCTWENVPSDSDSELLMAQRVREDCKP